jgi:hypothetical protein
MPGPGAGTTDASFLAGPMLQVRNFLSLDAGLVVPMHGPQAHSLYAGAVYNVGRIR